MNRQMHTQISSSGLSLRELVLLLGMLAVVVAFVLPKLGKLEESSTADRERYEAQSVVATMARTRPAQGEGGPVTAGDFLFEESAEFAVALEKRPRVVVLPSLPDEPEPLVFDDDPDVD